MQSFILRTSQPAQLELHPPNLFSRSNAMASVHGEHPRTYHCSVFTTFAYVPRAAVLRYLEAAAHGWRHLSQKRRRPRAPPRLTCYATNIFEGVQWRLNPFVFDINVRTGTGQKTMKRVLLDTGSDLNLISNSVHREIGSTLNRKKHSVRSLAGQSSIVGETTLSWNFITSSPQTTSPPQVDVFFVLARTESTSFDCILGHSWIWSHLDIFSALMRSEQPQECAATLFSHTVASDASCASMSAFS